jgi:hypothetical protein
MHDNGGKCFQKIDSPSLLKSSDSQSDLAFIDFAKLIDLVVKDLLCADKLVLP